LLSAGQRQRLGLARALLSMSRPFDGARGDFFRIV
jgi:hypothetical protein